MWDIRVGAFLQLRSAALSTVPCQTREPIRLLLWQGELTRAEGYWLWTVSYRACGGAAATGFAALACSEQRVLLWL